LQLLKKADIIVFAEIIRLFTREVHKLPNIKSAKKRVIVTRTKALNNQMRRSSLKTVIKAFENDKTQDNYNAAVKAIDKAAAKGIMHKNAAARKKSQLTLALNKA